MTNKEIDEAVASEVMGWARAAVNNNWTARTSANTYWTAATDEWSPTTKPADAFRVLADSGLEYTLHFSDGMHRLGVYHGDDKAYTEYGNGDLCQAIACGSLFAARAAITLEEFSDE